MRLVGRLAEAGVTQGLSIGERKPEWMRAKVRLGEGPQKLRRTLRDLDLVTVCEEAGCPNLSECWADGTATFMINGERCTRACGFCLVDTRHPMALDADEPGRVAEAVERMGLRVRGRDRGGPRRPRRRWRRRVRGDHPGHPHPQPGDAGRGADPRLQGRPRRAGHDRSTPAPTC